MADNIIHYVKFLRGSTAAYEQLKTANRLDSDTLYFVYTNKNATRGLLYLGDKLISGSVDGGGSVISDVALTDLADVQIDDNSLSNYQILIYDESEDAWVNSDLSQIIETAVSVMQGPTLVSPGKSGLVPQPRVGDDTKFLKGDGTWASINIPTFDSRQFQESSNGDIIIKNSLSANLNQILASDGAGGLKFVEMPTGTLTRTIVNSTDEIDLTEVNKIYMIRKTDPELEDDHYDEFMIIDGEIERVGGFTANIDLTGYATKTFVNNEIKTLTDILYDTETVDNETGETTTVSGLISKVDKVILNQAIVGDLTNYSTSYTLVDAIDDINERLAWGEIDNP